MSDVKVCKSLREMCPKFQFGRCINRFYCTHEAVLQDDDTTEFNERHWGLRQGTMTDIALLYDFIRNKTK